MSKFWKMIYSILDLSHPVVKWSAEIVKLMTASVIMLSVHVVLVT